MPQSFHRENSSHPNKVCPLSSLFYEENGGIPPLAAAQEKKGKGASKLLTPTLSFPLLLRNFYEALLLVFGHEREGSLLVLQ